MFNIFHLPSFLVHYVLWVLHTLVLLAQIAIIPKAEVIFTRVSFAKAYLICETLVTGSSPVILTNYLGIKTLYRAGYEFHHRDCLLHYLHEYKLCGIYSNYYLTYSVPSYLLLPIGIFSCDAILSSRA